MNKIIKYDLLFHINLLFMMFLIPYFILENRPILTVLSLLCNYIFYDMWKKYNKLR